MPKIKIKEEFKMAQVGFNGSGLPLGLRDDLHVLAQLAIESKDQSLLNMFETLPSLEDCKEEAGEKFLEANPEPTAAKSKTNEEKSNLGKTTPTKE